MKRHIINRGDKMKRAVVFGGGGTRGSYEMGAWTALREMGYEYDIVTGTSIGSVNGALMVQGDYERASALWDEITVDDVIVNGFNLEYSIEAMFNQKKDLMKFLKKYITSKGADITPFKKLLAEIINEQRIRESTLEFGLVTVQFPSLKALEITKSSIRDGFMKQYILASASCFPAFPMCKINGNNYIDGGYYDALPIDFAVKMGAEELVAIDLSYNTTHSAYLNRPYVKYVKPSWPIGSFLNFEQELLHHNRVLGYLDTKRAFGKLDGYRYSFFKEDEPNPEVQNRFISYIAQFEAFLPAKKPGLFKKATDSLTMYLEEFTGHKKMTNADYVIRGSEICAEYLEIDPLRVYHFQEFRELILQKFNEIKKQHDESVFQNLHEISDISKLYEEIRKTDQRFLLSTLYYYIANRNDWLDDLNWFAVAVPKQLTAAFYLLAADPPDRK